MSTATSTTPYRAKPRGSKVTLAVYPLLVVRLVLLMGVLLLIVSSLHAFLWSRVVHVRCDRAVGRVSCVVDESSLVRSARFERDATFASRAVVRGEVARSRGDAWIALVEVPVERELTSGFNGDKAGQQRAAEALTAFFEGDARSVAVTYGSRWGAAWIFLVLFGCLFGLVYPFFCYRVRVTIDRGERSMAIDRGPWPFARRAAMVPLATVTGFTIEGDSRVRLVMTSKDQPSVPCTWRVGSVGPLHDATDRLNAWLRAEQERALES